MFSRITAQTYVEVHALRVTKTQYITFLLLFLLQSRALANIWIQPLRFGCAGLAAAIVA